MKYIVKLIFFLLPFVIVFGLLWLFTIQGTNNLFAIIGIGTMIYFGFRLTIKLGQRFYPEGVLIAESERKERKFSEKLNRHFIP